MVQTKAGDKTIKTNGGQPPAPRRRKSSKDVTLVLKDSKSNLNSNTKDTPATKPTQKGRKKSVVLADNQLTLVKNGELGDFAIHLWHDELKILHDGILVLAGELKLFEEFLDNGEIPPELIPLFYEANVKFIKGHIVAQIFDYRHIKDSNPTDTRVEDAKRRSVALKPNQMSIQADLAFLNYKASGKLSEEQILLIESEILLMNEPTLDLSINLAGNRVKNALQILEDIDKPVPVKDLKNSTELEDEARELEEIRNMLLTMDEKRLKKWDIEGVELCDFISASKTKQTEKNKEITAGLDTKRAKANQELHTIVSNSCQLVRTIRYEREIDSVREGTVMDTSIGGFTRTFMAANNLGQNFILDTNYVTKPLEKVSEPVLPTPKTTVSTKLSGAPVNTGTIMPQNKTMVRPFMQLPGNKLPNTLAQPTNNQISQISTSDGMPVTHPGNFTAGQLQAYQESRYMQIFNESQQLIESTPAETNGTAEPTNVESATAVSSVTTPANQRASVPDTSVQRQGIVNQPNPGQFVNANQIQGLPRPPLQQVYGGFPGQNFQRPQNPMLVQNPQNLAMRQVQLLASLMAICTPQQKVALRNLHDKNALSNQEQQIIQSMLSQQNLNHIHRSLLTFMVHQYTAHHNRAGYPNDAQAAQVRPQNPPQGFSETTNTESGTAGPQPVPQNSGAHPAPEEMQNEMLTALLKQQQAASNQQAFLKQQQFKAPFAQQRVLGVRPGFMQNANISAPPNAQGNNQMAMQQSIMAGLQANANNANPHQQPFGHPISDKMQQLRMQQYAQYIAQAHDKGTQMLQNVVQPDQVPGAQTNAQSNTQQHPISMPLQDVNNGAQNSQTAPLTPYVPQNNGMQQGAASIGSVSSVHQTPAAATPQLGHVLEDHQQHHNSSVHVPQTPTVHSVNQSETMSGGLHTPNLSLSMTPQLAQTQLAYSGQNLAHNQEVLAQLRQKNMMQQVAMNQAQASKQQQPRPKRTSMVAQQVQPNPHLNTEIAQGNQAQPNMTPQPGQVQMEFISPNPQQGSDFDSEHTAKRAKIRPQSQLTPQAQVAQIGMDTANNPTAQPQTNFNAQNQAMLNSLNSTALNPQHLNLLSRLQQQPNLTPQQQQLLNGLQQKIKMHNYQQNLYLASQQNMRIQQQQQQQQPNGQNQTLINEQQNVAQQVGNQSENGNSVTATPIQPRPQTPSLNQTPFNQNMGGQDAQATQAQFAQAQAAQLAIMQQRQAQQRQQFTQAQLNQVQQAQLSQQLLRRQQLMSQYSQQIHPAQMGNLQRPNFNNQALQQQYLALQQQGLQNAMAQNPNLQLQLMNMAQANMALQNGNRPNFPPNARIGIPQGARPGFGLPHNFQMPNNGNNPPN